MSKFLAIGLLPLVLTACSSSTPGEVNVNASHNGKTIDLTQNQTLVFTLESNATTGYKWNLVTEPDATVLKLTSSQYNAPSNPGVVGAGGTETWKFQAIGKGTTTLKLGYFRPFDPKQVNKEFLLTVNVNPPSAPSSPY